MGVNQGEQRDWGAGTAGRELDSRELDADNSEDDIGRSTEKAMGEGEEIGR